MRVVLHPMNVSVPLVLSGFFALAPVLGSPGERQGVASGQEDPVTLVQQLLDENYKVRETATARLWAMGDSALPALETAASSDEPEQALRAREILRKIRLFITPDTDPDVIAMVEGYFRASIEEKNALLARMMQKRAWRQMLKLYAAEPREEVREKLRPLMAGVSTRAARESIRKGRIPEALEFLELAPVDSDSLLALADYHLANGTLRDEIARAREIPGEKSLIWQLAMARAAGDIKEARKIAARLDNIGVEATMAMLDGDPLPWLNAVIHREVGDAGFRGGRQRHDPFEEPFGDAEEGEAPSKQYLNSAINRWKGGKNSETDLKELEQRARSRNKQVASSAITELLVLGEDALAAKSFAKTLPLQAFLHYDALERVPEALGALGVNPGDDDDLRAWVEKRVAKIGKRDAADEHEVSTESEELLLIANFMERRGLDEAAYQAFFGALAVMAKDDLNNYQDFLGLLFGNRSSQSGAPALAARLTRGWAGGDPKRWEEAVGFAFGDDDDTAAWWSWMGEMAPEVSVADRFSGLLALHSEGGADKSLREKWLALAWESTEAAGADKDSRLKRILDLGLETDDVDTTLKAWDRLPEDARPETSWVHVMFHLSAAERWNDCAKMISDQIDQVDEDSDDQNPALHAYAAAAWRKAGNVEKAAQHDAWAEKLALGDSPICSQIGHGYAFGADFERAEKWWFRAIMLAEPGSFEMLQSLKSHSEALVESGEWAKMAAVSEAMACMHLSGRVQTEIPLPIMRLRLEADMGRALTMLPDKRQKAIAILRECHLEFSRDGSLADFFFPALRKVGLHTEHDSWFGESWEQISRVIEQYPGADNTANTAAWLAARAARKLDVAERLLANAIDKKPAQSAYLDTMAEIQFAKGDRGKALEWSRRAVRHMPQDSQLRRQQSRFLSAPFPAK